MKKRDFIKTSGLLAMGMCFKMPALANALESYGHLSAQNLSNEEAFWENLRKGYDLPKEFINLENGYYCVQPREILAGYIKHLERVNRLGAYYMRTRLLQDKLEVAALLAKQLGAEPNSLAITRNTTEALNLVISGFNWKVGDEAIYAEQDYGAMRDMFKQVGLRYGVKLKVVSIPNHPKSDEELVKLYEQAVTPQTRLLHVPHIVNITGHILPIRKICDMAHAKGVQVLVDGAHAFAHFDFKLSELHADYYGCSLHKWLSSPLGAGFLYVKPEHISKTWPLFAEDESVPATDILHLNHTGTAPPHTHLAIVNALAYYNKLGATRKEARLRYLQQYWTSQVRGLPNIILNTPELPERACAIANVGIATLTPAQLADVLFTKYKIYTVAIDTNTVKGCRITPNVFTRLSELDVLVKALKELSV